MKVYSCSEVDANGVLTLQEESSIRRNVPYIVNATYGEPYKFVGPEAIDADNPSFQDGLLAPPVYTRPAEFNGWKVPEILLSGDPKKIAAWQDEQALERTKRLRPELLK